MQRHGKVAWCVSKSGKVRYMGEWALYSYGVCCKWYRANYVGLAGLGPILSVHYPRSRSAIAKGNDIMRYQNVLQGSCPEKYVPAGERLDGQR